MQIGEFWDLIAQAGATAERSGRWPTGNQVGQALASQLEALPEAEIIDFDAIFSRVAQQAHQWELCAACFLISGYLSDDAFTDFKAGLVSLGREPFERIVGDPDSLADLPVVAAIADGTADPFTLHGEQMTYAAAEAYAAKTGDDEEFYEFDTAPTEAQGGWSGEFGPADGPAIPGRLPRLYARFPRELRDAAHQ